MISNNITDHGVDNFMKSYIRDLASKWISHINKCIDLFNTLSLNRLEIIDPLDQFINVNNYFTSKFRRNYFDEINSTIHEQIFRHVEIALLSCKDFTFGLIEHYFSYLDDRQASILSKQFMSCNDLINSDETFMQFYKKFSVTYSWNNDVCFYCIVNYLERKLDVYKKYHLSEWQLSYLYWSHEVINRHLLIFDFVDMSDETHRMFDIKLALTTIMNSHLNELATLKKFNSPLISELCRLHKLI